VLKGIIAITLTLSILASNLVNVSIGLYYHFNKEYISKQLCVNRNNPQMHCNGHCFLSKQLKKAEQNEKRSAQFIKEKDEIAPDNSALSKLNYFPVYRPQSFLSFNSTLYVSGSNNPLIKPPAV
jgi:hypothetical protein